MSKYDPSNTKPVGEDSESVLSKLNVVAALSRKAEEFKRKREHFGQYSVDPKLATKEGIVNYVKKGEFSYNSKTRFTLPVTGNYHLAIFSKDVKSFTLANEKIVNVDEGKFLIGITPHSPFIDISFRTNSPGDSGIQKVLFSEATCSLVLSSDRDAELLTSDSMDKSIAYMNIQNEDEEVRESEIPSFTKFKKRLIQQSFKLDRSLARNPDKTEDGLDLNRACQTALNSYLRINGEGQYDIDVYNLINGSFVNSQEAIDLIKDPSIHSARMIMFYVVLKKKFFRWLYISHKILSVMVVARTDYSKQKFSIDDTPDMLEDLIVSLALDTNTHNHIVKPIIDEITDDEIGMEIMDSLTRLEELVDISSTFMRRWNTDCTSIQTMHSEGV